MPSVSSSLIHILYSTTIALDMVELLGLYNFIPAPHRKLFKSKITKQSLKKGDFVLIDGEIQNKLYLVKQGILMMYFDMEEKRQVVDFAYLNRFCVDIESFSNQNPSIYCIECLHDAEVEWISYEDLQFVFDHSIEIERAFRLLTEKILSSVVRRQLNRQIKNIQERFFLVMGKRPELFKLVPHKYIASYIDINPTNFSKLYNHFCANDKLFFQ